MAWFVTNFNRNIHCFFVVVPSLASGVSESIDDLNHSNAGVVDCKYCSQIINEILFEEFIKLCRLGSYKRIRYSLTE